MRTQTHKSLRRGTWMMSCSALVKSKCMKRDWRTDFCQLRWEWGTERTQEQHSTLREQTENRVSVFEPFNIKLGCYWCFTVSWIKTSKQTNAVKEYRQKMKPCCLSKAHTHCFFFFTSQMPGSNSRCAFLRAAWKNISCPSIFGLHRHIWHTSKPDKYLCG